MWSAYPRCLSFRSVTEGPVSIIPVVRSNKAKPEPIPRNMRRALCVEYLRDMNLPRVAAMFDTDEMVVRRIINSPVMRDHLASSLGDTSDLDKLASRRLLEILLEEAFNKEPSKERTEARKMLARHYLPKRSEGMVEHRFFVEIPAKASAAEWEKKYSGNQLPTGPPPEEDEDLILDAELVEDE